MFSNDENGGKKRALSVVPVHVAIIMDGNGRWAKEHGLSRLQGHRVGTENIRQVIRIFVEKGVKYLTLYAFSTENWGRPRREVLGLLRILGEVIEREAEALNREGVKILHLGKVEGLSGALQGRIKKALELTKNNNRLILGVALNYGGRDEIINAIKKIINDKVSDKQVNEEMFRGYLCTAGLPDPDLIIRTGGDLRLSNFLIWQSAYSEFYVTPVYWPDFNKAEIEKALDDYAKRQRRFGGLNPDNGKSGGGAIK